MKAEWGVRTPSPLVACTLIVIAVVTFVLIGSGRVRIAKTRWATIPGRLTYPVYLVHQFAGCAAYAAMVRAGTPPVLALVVVTASAIVIGWGINRYVERPVGPRLRELVGARREPGDSSA